jgi:hypothetical protein
VSKPSILASIGASILLALGLTLSIRAVECLTAVQISGELKNRAVAADGKIHVKYSFFDPNEVFIL